MDTIIFKDGVAIFKRNPAYVDEAEVEYPVESLIRYLGCVVELSEGTTVEHIWSYLEHDADFFNNVYAQAIGNFPLKLFIDQFHKPSAELDHEGPTKVELYWHGEIWEGEISIFPSCHGKDDKGGGWAIEFTAINDLKSFPIILDDELEIYDMDAPLDKDGMKPIWKGKKDWTVYDMYFAFLYEMTFCGSPEDQVRQLADLDQRLADAKEQLRTGTANFVKFEDLIDSEENGSKPKPECGLNDLIDSDEA